MTMPTKLTEADLWPNARDIVHFIGICGAGKSTLSSRLAARVALHGGRAIGTIDYDPHTPDTIRLSERAFSRDLDRRNIEADCSDPAVHQEIVDHTLATLRRWMESDANVVLVDRWYESYDNLPRTHVEYIEAAIRSAGFRIHHVLLIVANGVFGNEDDAIRQRMLHTKRTRPEEWWATGPGSLDAWVRDEKACQDAYRLFVHRSPFGSITLNTARMEWADHEDAIVSSLLEGRWLEAVVGSSAPALTRFEGASEGDARLEPQECTFAQFRQIAEAKQYGPFEGEPDIPARTMVWFRGSVLCTLNSTGEAALRDAHRRAVQEALYMNSEASERDFFRKQVRLPSTAALEDYPDLRDQFGVAAKICTTPCSERPLAHAVVAGSHAQNKSRIEGGGATTDAMSGEEHSHFGSMVDAVEADLNAEGTKTLEDAHTWVMDSTIELRQLPSSVVVHRPRYEVLPDGMCANDVFVSLDAGRARYPRIAEAAWEAFRLGESPESAGLVVLDLDGQSASAATANQKVIQG